MVDFQLSLPGLSRNFNELTDREKDFVSYFSRIDMDCVSPVIDCYAGIGPKGYSVSLVLAPDHQNQRTHPVGSSVGRGPREERSLPVCH